MLSFIFLTFIIGICIGSFLNVCIYRIPKKESIVFGSSHCMSCGQTIKPYDLIPIISYLLLGGRCRSCSTKLPIRYPLIELINGILYILIFLMFGLSLQTLVAFVLVSTLLVLAMIDIDTMEVPNGIVLFIVGLGLINLLVFGQITFLNAMLGMLAGSLPLLLLAILSNGGMGGGDIKLMGACGLILGWQNTLLALFVASILATLSCIPLLLNKQKGLKDSLPFVPFLAVGLVVCYFFGAQILKGYMGLFF